MIMIARIMGSHALGQYTLAFNFYFIFMTLLSQGFKTLFTRELSRKSSDIQNHLVGGSVLQVFLSILGYFVLVTIVNVLPYSADTTHVCNILGLMIIPFSISNITESIFQAQEKMHLIAISSSPIYFVRLLIAIEAMRSNHGLIAVSIIMIISEIIIALIQWIMVIRYNKFQWKIDFSFIVDTLMKLFVFLAIEGIAVFKSRMLFIIVSLFSSETVVGLFGAIIQLLQPFEIVAHSLVVAVFPRMTKAVNLGKNQQRHLAEFVVEILLCVALAIMLGSYFFGADTLILIYGQQDFSQAATALNYVVAALAVASFTRPLGYLLVANGLEKINLFEVTISSIFGLILGIILIPVHSLLGASISFLLMGILTSLIYIISVQNYLFGLRFQKIFIWPLIINFFMLIVFLFLHKLSNNIVNNLALATLAFGIQFGIVHGFRSGSFQFIWNKIKHG
jgi:O-antigen/teichoic acid export membrane protein